MVLASRWELYRASYDLGVCYQEFLGLLTVDEVFAYQKVWRLRWFSYDERRFVNHSVKFAADGLTNK